MPPADVAPCYHGCRVLVVEGHPDGREMLRLLLELLG
jgi:hypothetical protein